MKNQVALRKKAAKKVEKEGFILLTSGSTIVCDVDYPDLLMAREGLTGAIEEVAKKHK